MRRLAGLLLCLMGTTAVAHTLAPALLDIQASDDSHYAALWRIDLRSGLPDPRWPTHCEASAPEKQLRDSALESRWELHCPGGLNGHSLRLDGIQQSRTAVLFHFTDHNGQSHQQLLAVDEHVARIPIRPQGHQLWLQYGQLGLTHILGGIDHLLLVVAIFLLASGWRALLLDISAFTAGHSLTLAAAGLGGFWLPSGVVELAIALSLLWLALDLSRGGRRPPWPLFVAFGLIHGLGFAGALKELGLPTGAEVAALLSFNLGIEAGQILVLLVLAAGTRLLDSATGRDRVPLRWVGIYAIGSLGGMWLLQRGTSLLL